MGEYVKGLVSVVIPTYRRSDLLEKSINSVLNQTYDNIELLVVNDNDKGDEFSISLYKLMSKFTDPRVRLVEQESHINGAGARNAGIRASHGEYIEFLDDDDTWDPRKTELQVKVLEGLDRSWGGVSCLRTYSIHDRMYRATLPYRDGYIFERVLMLLTDIATGSILMRREALDDAGYFDVNLTRFDDVQLFSFFTKKYKVRILKRHLFHMDSCDAQNRPSSERLRRSADEYLKSVDSLMDDNPQLRGKLRAHLRFIIGVAELKEKKIGKGLKEIFSTLGRPSVFFGECGVYINKIRERTERNMILRRFRDKKEEQ